MKAKKTTNWKHKIQDVEAYMQAQGVTASGACDALGFPKKQYYQAKAYQKRIAKEAEKRIKRAAKPKAKPMMKQKELISASTPMISAPKRGKVFACMAVGSPAEVAAMFAKIAEGAE